MNIKFLNYEKNVMNKICAMLIIIALTFSDFMLIGANIVSYANDMIQTNNSNVKFNAYFKEDDIVSSVEKKIDEEGARLFVDVSVENEGYFNGKISLNNNNFKFKTNQSGEFIKNITETEVELNQINAGSSITLELAIDPVTETITTLNKLNSVTNVNISGSYVNSKNVENEKYIEINGTAKVEVDWKSSDSIELEMESKVITAGEYAINEISQKMVQILVTSKVTNNNYPVRNTEITLDVPSGVEKVEVFSRSNSATNSNLIFSSKNYNYDEENNKLTINIENEDENNISWNKNVEDAFIVTYIYKEDSDIKNETISVEGTVNTYDDKELVKKENVQIDNKIDGILTYDLQSSESSIYKGKLYTGESRVYNTTTNMYINYVGIANEVTLNEPASKLMIGEKEVIANTVYKTVSIDRNQMIYVLGEDGYITIKDSKGTIIANLTKNSDVDENGMIVVDCKNSQEVNIATSVPQKQGTIKIENEKSIENSNLSRDTVNAITSLKETVDGKYNNENEKIVDASIEMKNTSTKASLEVNTTTLSAIETNEKVKMTVVLDNNDESRDLYQNPNIKITLPGQVSKISEAKYKMLYGNGLEIASCKMSKENGNYVFNISLSGTQTTYNTEVLEGTTIILYANMDISRTATNSDEEITMTYTNDLATSFEDNGIEESNVRIETITGMITTNDIEEYNVETVGKQETQDINLAVGTVEKNATVKISTINAEGAKVDNVAIVGSLPTNTNLGVTLNSAINVTTNTNSVKVYYSNEENPTSDLNMVSNGWTENISKNSKSYLITIDSLENGEEFSAEYGVNIPGKLIYNLSAEEGYNVTYTNELTSADKEADATTLVLTTGAGAEIKSELKAFVGGKEIKDGDTVYSGEVVTYQLDLTNTGNAIAQNANIEFTLPENATYVEYVKGITTGAEGEKPEDTNLSEDDNPYVTDYYKTENVENNLITTNIEKLDVGETKSYSYELKVSETATGELDSNVKISFDGIENNIEMKNSIENSDVSLEMYMIQRTESIVQIGSSYVYYLKVNNNSGKKLKNVDIETKLEGFNITKIITYSDAENVDFEANKFTIDSMEENETKRYMIYVSSNETYTDKLKVLSVANEKYYSNLIEEEAEKEIASISMSSEQDGKSLKAGEELVYNIKVKNDGAKTIENLYVKQQLDSTLDIEKVLVDGEEVEYTKELNADNTKSISLYESLENGKTSNIEIDTRVNPELALIDDSHISSTAKAIYMGGSSISDTINNTILSYNNANNINDDSNNDNNGNNDNNDSNNNNENNSNGESKENVSTYTISGVAWLDANSDGQRDSSEQTLNGINVTVLNIENNETYDTVTTANGFYSLTNIENGKYVVIFEYDTSKYILTTYRANGIPENRNSDAENVKMNINGEEKDVSATETIVINGNSATNVDIGLAEAKNFDMELTKTISKVTITNASGTQTKECNNSTLEKVEVAAKYMKGTTVVVEYKISVKNTGEAAGYIKNIVDYKPSDLTFNSNLNPEWYQSGSNVYTTSLNNTKLEPGETKELTLVLTKTMTESNTGLVDNTAELADVYNPQNLSDMDSTPANKLSKEDDMGQADLIISVKTGAMVSYVTLTLSVIIVIAAGAYLIAKKLLKNNINF